MNERFSKRSDEGFDTKTKNKFTIFFNLAPQNDRNITLNVGSNFTFEINNQDCSIEQISNNLNSLKKKEIKAKRVKLLHYNNAQEETKSFIWVSVYALDLHKPENNFIKIGYGDLLESNILAHYTETNEGFELLKSITIHDVSFDDSVKVIEKSCLIDPFVMNYGPLIIDEHQPRHIEELERNNLTIKDLKEKSPETERLYSKIKEIYLTENEVNAIDYSCRTNNCTLNKILKEKKNHILELH